MALELRKLLIIEDSLEQLNQLKNYFSKKNTIYAASTLYEGIDIAKNQILDGIILDLVLPDGDGMQLFNHVEYLPPVIILSDIDNEEIMLDGFHNGALDYVVKPCSCELLEARLELRLLPLQKSIISSKGLTIDSAKRTCYFKDSTINLTSSEFNILYFLMTHQGQYFTSYEIYEQVWRMKNLNTTTIKRHLSTLRKKLALACDVPLIHTQFGKGYCFI